MKKIMRTMAAIMVFIVYMLFLNSCTFILFNVLDKSISADEEDVSGDEVTVGDNTSGDDNTDSSSQKVSYQIIEVSDSTFTLAWETDDPTIETYKIFYKIQNMSSVVELEEVTVTAGDDVQIEIASSQFYKNVSIILGVAAVDDTGEMSDIHFSTDDTAVPSGGWILQVK